jgi:acyl-CoA thioester hydrolase
MKKRTEEAPVNAYMIAGLKIGPEQIDERGHVNNIVYLNWIQQAAENHWKKLAGEQADQFAWVVRRHEIDYRTPIFPGADIAAVTWVGDTDALSSIRMVRIQTREGLLYAEAKTTWCLIDPQSGRFRRIPDSVQQLLGK